MKRLAMIAAFSLMSCAFWSCLTARAGGMDSSSIAAGHTETQPEPVTQTQPELVSARLAALRKELETGNRAAVEQFWQEVTAQGAPIIEPIQGDDRNLLVTFLWRAKQETRNVLVYAGLGGGTIAKNQMTRLMDTDLWYKTYRVPRDARFTYALSPNDSLVPIEDVDEKDIAKRFTTFRIDPLNKRSSIVELPGAPLKLGASVNPKSQRVDLKTRRSRARFLRTNAGRGFTLRPVTFATASRTD